MIEKQYTIIAEEGLHARPATELLHVIKRYKSKVTIKNKYSTCESRSIIGILSLQASFNSHIRVKIEGQDEKELAEALDRFFQIDILRL